MHLLIPFAAPVSEAGRQALASLELPGLQRLLSRMVPDAVDAGDIWSLSPPHERALGRALGWQVDDGCLPWAARAAAADGIATDDRAWGLLSPTHWHLGTDQVSLIDPASLLLDEHTSRALFDAVQDLFTSRGFTMVWGSASRWYAAHESLAALPCASLDRVVGRNVDRWMGQGAALRPLRLLQSEVQMVLHDHPLNAERESRGLLPVNSVWLSACGLPQAVTGVEPRVDDRLRAPALADDWPAWVRAWQTLDEGPLTQLAATGAGAAESLTRLTLCGERSAQDFHPAPAGGVVRWFRGLLPKPSVLPVLEAL